MRDFDLSINTAKDGVKKFFSVSCKLALKEKIFSVALFQTYSILKLSKIIILWNFVEKNLD